MFPPMETDGPAVPRTSAAMRDYLDAETAASTRSMRGVLGQVLRYGALRVSALSVVLPFENAVILRQVQSVPLGRDDGYKSASVLCLERRESIFGAARAISRSSLGTAWLWRGLGVSWAAAILRDILDVGVEGGMASFLAHGQPPAEAITLVPALASGIVQGLAGVLLAPLEVLRLRKVLVVDDAALAPVGMCAPFPLFTFASSALRRLVRTLPLALGTRAMAALFPAGELGTPAAITWLALQNALLCVPLLVTLPADTIRRRLYAQRAVAGGTPVVDLAAVPYASPAECLRRVLSEEGPAALYQGWGVHVAATTASFLAAAVAEMGADADFSDAF